MERVVEGYKQGVEGKCKQEVEEGYKQEEVGEEDHKLNYELED